MTKDELKNRISMALKDPVLQQVFEIICKENAELKAIADFQTSSNMDRYFQLKRSKEQLTKAEEIILKLSACLEGHSNNNFEYELLQETEQFLKEVSA
jgi:aromatic ring hydroxylase